MPASISITIGNVCETGVPLTSWPVCRAALSLAPFRIDGDAYQGTENDAAWPKGCYNCDGVSGCADGVWFNENSAGSANGEASIICSPDLEPVDSGGTLFVGDSDIDYWLNMEHHLTSDILQPVLNVGYAGFTCTEVLDEADDIIAVLKPSRVVLVCGENDLASGSSVTATFSRYKEVVTKYAESGAKVYSFSTKPEPETTYLHGDYEALDTMIKTYALDGSVTFIDSYEGFNAIGNPSSGSENLYDSDNLHLSAKGYALWQTWLDIALNEEESGCQVYVSGLCVQGGATDSPSAASSNAEDTVLELVALTAESVNDTITGSGMEIGNTVGGIRAESDDPAKSMEQPTTNIETPSTATADPIQTENNDESISAAARQAVSSTFLAAIFVGLVF